MAPLKYIVKYRSRKSNTYTDSLSRKTTRYSVGKRLERIEATTDLTIERPVRNLLPTLQQDIQSVVDSVWSETLHAIPKRYPPLSSSSTIPSLTIEELAKLQKNDPYIGRLIHLRQRKHVASKQQLLQELRHGNHEVHAATEGNCT